MYAGVPIIPRVLLVASVASALAVAAREVAVDARARGCSGGPGGCAPDHLEDPGAGARRGDPARERLAVDELHREEGPPAEIADVVDGDHVRVRQPRHRARLALEL